MIISASRRTDLPAFFPKETIEKILKYNGGSDIVQGVVFWTKNAEPIIPYLHLLTEKNIPFYFQYTLNYYPEFEHNLPNPAERLDTFRELSDRIGKNRVIWRFDPVVLRDGFMDKQGFGNKCDIREVIRRLNTIASSLKDHTEKLVFSYFDPYWKCPTDLRPPTPQEQAAFRDAVRGIHEKYGLTVATCAEPPTGYGEGEVIQRNACIDPVLLKQIGAVGIDETKDTHQRALCGCCKSIDIGKYHTCKHACDYCYAK
jgi:DNA repair photolyase